MEQVLLEPKEGDKGVKPFQKIKKQTEMLSSNG